MRSLRHVLPAVIALIAILSFGASEAQADEAPTMELSGSYVLVRSIGYGNDYNAGWLISWGNYFTRFLGVVGEIGGSYKTSQPLGEVPALKASLYNFMGGPKVALHQRHAIVPFAQVLLGSVRGGNNSAGHVSRFSWQPGAGVDINLTRSLGIRLQGDYRRISLDGASLKQFRLATGIVFGK